MLNARNYTPYTGAGIVVLLAILCTVNSCNLISPESDKTVFKNPYIEETNYKFSEAAKSIFQNIATRIEETPPTGVSSNDLYRFANEGYMQWAENNNYNAHTFKSGYNASVILNSESSNEINRSTKTISSIRNKLNLSPKQSKFLSRLPEIAAQSENLSQLKINLTEFDTQVYRDLGLGSSKPILKMSALIRASMTFIYTKARLLASLADLVEQNNTQSYFNYPKENYIHLAGNQSGPTDPPDANDYFDQYEIAQATFNGILAGAGAGAGLGLWTGGGVGGIIGGIIGGVFVGSFNAYTEFYSQLSAYSDDVQDWCEDPMNYSHPDYETMCETGSGWF